jgi:hypothetical protein
MPYLCNTKGLADRVRLQIAINAVSEPEPAPAAEPDAATEAATETKEIL